MSKLFLEQGGMVGESIMKVGDLVVSKDYQSHANFVPARRIVQTTIGGTSSRNDKQYIVLEDEPNNWKLAKNFFVVSRA